MTQLTADVVICGAGIAGVSAAYHLTVRSGVRNVLLVEERAPLTLTSDKSTECYRNWWPGPGHAMVSLMNRSIDILEELAHESGNFFHLSRRGYVFATADPTRIPILERTAEEAAQLGAGPLRYHTGRSTDPPYIPGATRGYEGQPSGCDFILDSELIRKYFPYLSESVVALVHARRCGWLSAQQLGMYLLERAREHDLRILRGRVDAINVAGNRVQTVHVRSGNTIIEISTRHFVNAAGPFVKHVGQMIGVDLPVFCELHLKVALDDHLGVVPRDGPLLIGTDPIRLPWSDEESALLAESPETRWLLERLPPGVHTRPEGGPDSRTLLLLWTYHTEKVEPVFPFTTDSLYTEIALRGLATMIPDLRVYFDRIPKATIDGGYYTKTQENRPLIGPLPVQGAYVIGALSGFGVMAACAAGELLAAHVCGTELPDYASAFLLERYKDAEYQRLLRTWRDSGQI